jgi:hypothetical protein
MTCKCVCLLNYVFQNSVQWAVNLWLLLGIFLILRVKFLGEISTISCKFMAFIGNIFDTMNEISR